MANDAGWVDSWVSTPQPTRDDQLPPAPFTQDRAALVDTTVRQTVRVTVGGDRVRVRFSNAWGDSPLSLSAATGALPAGGRAGVRAIAPDSAQRLRFAGRASVSVPPGAQVESDPVGLTVAPGANLAVSLFLAHGQPARGLTSHPGSRTTSYLVPGDHAAAPDLPGATPVAHWYFLSGVSVPARPGTAVAALVGDSLTDGRGSTTDGNDRWLDALADRLRSHADTREVAVLNHATGGTRLLDDGRGPDPVARLVREALARRGLRWVFVLKGVNDLGVAADTDAAQQRTVADLLAAYARVAADLRRHGVRVYGVTLPPFGGHAGYDDPAGRREVSRQQVNDWVRADASFDRVVDADLVLRDPAHPRTLAPRFDGGDHLHLSPAGYQALAAAVPLDLFAASR